MIIDGRSVELGSTIEADLCIVGAGPAGITLALQYLGSNTTVVLLESGGTKWNERTQNLADFEVDGAPYFPPKETHIRMFGGSTTAWGGICTPLDPIDFEPRPWVPNSGWSISRKAIEPYYKEALRLCGVDPASSESRAESTDSSGVEWTPLHFTAPARFGPMYGPTVRDASNIMALVHSSVTELDLHRDGGHIEGVRIACIGGNSYRVRARNYILAGGGIENPRLLLASNRIAKEGIGNDHDVVGRFFAEHPRVTDRHWLPPGARALAAHIPTELAMLRFSRLRLTEEVQRNEELLNYQANLYFGYVGQDSDQWEALRRIVFSIRRNYSPYFPDEEGGRNVVRWADLRTALKRPDRSLLSLVGAALRPPGLRRWVEIMSSVEQPPLPNNRVVLSDKKDELGSALPRMIWSISAQEERTYRRGLEIVLKKLERYAPGISDARINHPDPWPEEITGTWHHMGTTRIHEDPRRGVVDANCRVHGVRNLFLAGSSVFPTGGAHSPTLTIIALALRLADHLKNLPATA